MKLGLVFSALATTACAAGCTPASSARSTAAPVIARAQAPVYRFDFSLKAADGIGAAGGETDRHYSMVLQQGAEGKVQAGNNVPLGAREHSPRVDTGVNVRCTYDVDGASLVLHTVLSMSSAGTTGEAGETVRKVEMVSDALVAPGKPAVVATIADPATQSRYELSVAATRLD